MNNKFEATYWGLFEKISKIDSPSVEKMGIYEGFYADFYNLTTHGYAPDAAEYLELAAVHPGPVLDVGCGTGRLLVHLAQQGHTVVGIDNSADMLKIAAGHVAGLPDDARARVKLFEGDATDFDLGEKFSLVLVSAFTFLTTAEARLEFFRSARNHITDDGCLAFDFLGLTEENVDVMDGSLSCVEIPTGDGAMLTIFGTKFTKERHHWCWNFLTQQTRVDGLLRQYLGTSGFARLDETELELTLEAAGFVIAEKRKSPQPLANTVATRCLYVCVPRASVKYPLWHPYFPMNHIDDQALVLVEGKGVSVRDRQGREYVDASGGLWSTQCGLGREEIIQAVDQQLRKLSYGTLFAFRSNEPAIALSRKLTELTPGSLTRVYLTCSGSESVELAMKLSRLYFHLDGRPEKNEIVYLDDSYHGTFYGSMGVTGLFLQKDKLGPHVPGLTSVSAPTPSRCPEGVSYLDYALVCAEELDTLLSERGEKIAAFIMEPILGSAGVVVPPREYLEAVQRICRKHEVLLVLDEVATGFGRTGRWFAYEHFGLRPDMLLLSKGINSGYLPLGAMMFTEQIGQKLLQHQVGIGHGSSANGNPACCAAALASIAVIEREDLIERSATMGQYFRDRLEELRSHEVVRDVRGLGLMCAVELANQRNGGRSSFSAEQVGTVYNAILNAGVLPYAFASGLSFFPSLTIARSEIDFIVDKLDKVLTGLD
jgi:adenosylmethionine-8-amino-7-oxononanoate aminotransferase/SAM-dependent methyltransferase